MLITLVKKWFEQLGVYDLTDEDTLNVIRKFKLDKLPPQYLLMMKMISPLLFMTLSKLRDETIDWGDMEEIPGMEGFKENKYAN